MLLFLLLLHLQKGPKKFECLIDSQWDSTKHLRELLSILLKLFKKLKREHLQTPSTRPALPKPKRTLLKETEKEN